MDLCELTGTLGQGLGSRLGLGVGGAGGGHTEPSTAQGAAWIPGIEGIWVLASQPSIDRDLILASQPSIDPDALVPLLAFVVVCRAAGF